MDRDNREFLEVRETKKDTSWKDATALLSLILGGLITYDLIRADFFNFDNKIQAILTAVFFTFTFHYFIFGICKAIAKDK